VSNKSHIRLACRTVTQYDRLLAS